MKFSVGDLVQVLADIDDHAYYGEVGEITEILDGDPYPYRVGIPSFPGLPVKGVELSVVATALEKRVSDAENANAQLRSEVERLHNRLQVLSYVREDLEQKLARIGDEVRKPT